MMCQETIDALERMAGKTVSEMLVEFHNPDHPDYIDSCHECKFYASCCGRKEWC